MNRVASLYKPYDQGVLTFFRGKLLEERVKIMARLERNSNPIFVEELNGAERIDKPLVFEKHNIEERRDSKELADVEEALKKIEDGSYGLCDVCQKRILLARLEACPTAESCVSCYAKEIQNHPRILKDINKP